MKSEALTDDDFLALARLQVACLPDSLVTRLGHRYARSFYRYIDRSDHERVVVHRRESRIVSACVMSFSPSTLDRRLIFNSSLLFALISRFYRLPLLKMISPKAAPTNSGDRQDAALHKGAPELILIFTAPELRGEGMGLKLIKQCERELLASGLDRYVVKTLDYTENRALKFYRSNGFRPLYQVVQHGKRYQVFERRLSSSEQTIHGSNGEKR